MTASERPAGFQRVAQALQDLTAAPVADVVVVA